MERLGVVIVAAGTGSRMNTAVRKQFLQLKDKPILVHAVEVFEGMPEVSEIVIVTGSSDINRVEQYISMYHWHKIKAIVPGGSDRQQSVYYGLQAVSSETEWVLIHDGVRPFVTPEAALRCLEGAASTGAAVLAVPVKDTIKQINDAGQIVATLERTSLRAIQTPQAFRRSLILEAHRTAMEQGWQATDDAALAEMMGHAVVAVDGDYRNIKITTPEDLAVAEQLLGGEA